MNHEPEHNAPSRLETLRSALQVGTLRPIQKLLRTLHPAEIGHLLEALPPKERNIVWGLLDPSDEGEILIHVNDEVRLKLIEGMDSAELMAAVTGMEVDDLADLLGDLPEAITQGVLTSMDSQNRERLRMVLGYSEDVAGGLMNIDTITVRADVTLEVVLRYLRFLQHVPDTTNTLFVVDRYGKYLGIVHLTRLITHDAHLTVADIMDDSVAAIDANTEARLVADAFEKLDLVSAPVIDHAGHLLGRITIDDVVDVIREEAEHSLMSMAGLDEADDMFAPVVPSAQRRAVWLGVNLATAFLAAWVVGIFDAAIEKVVALAVLMPVVASMGGVAGTQTLTLVIRGLALGQLERSNSRWMLFKEMAIGTLNGFAWAAVVAVVTVFWWRSWEIAAVIAGAMIINLLVAAIGGVLIPLMLKKLRIDPALAGSVVLTTVTDVVGFTAFLGLGAYFLT
ncbi:MAG: magnesium transporter [Gammaproteobacteria bacterium]|nr:magnesium transporter [Gammaproteobacteria bacterium]